MNKDKFPNIEALINVGSHMATKMNVNSNLNSEFRDCLNDILFERGTYDGMLAGITTEEEVSKLVLAHFHTLILRSPESHDLKWGEEESKYMIRQIKRGLVNT